MRKNVSPAAPPASAGSQLAQDTSKDVVGESEQLAKELWTSESEDDGVRVIHCPMHYLLSNSNRFFLDPDGNEVELCQHQNVRKGCPHCPKSANCEHNKTRRFCRICKENGTGGEGLCDAHHVRKDGCAGCKGLPGHGHRICKHGRFTSLCVECKRAGTGGWLLCDAHWQKKIHCKLCAKKVAMQAPQAPSTMATAFQATLDQGHRDRMANMVANARVPPVPAGDSNPRVIFTFGNGWAPLSGRAEPSHISGRAEPSHFSGRPEPSHSTLGIRWAAMKGGAGPWHSLS